MSQLPYITHEIQILCLSICGSFEAWKALESDWPGKSCIWLAKADGSGVTDYLEVLSEQSMAHVVDD